MTLSIQAEVLAAESLLKLHAGVCSVHKDMPIAVGFRVLNARGEVEITDCQGTPGYINVRRKAK